MSFVSEWGNMRHAVRFVGLDFVDCLQKVIVATLGDYCSFAVDCSRREPRGSAVCILGLVGRRQLLCCRRAPFRH